MASQQDRGDDLSNKELARELASRGDKEGIQELIDNLGHRDRAMGSDCIKTLYEIGYLSRC